MRERVEESIAKIRPALEADGGGIDLVNVTDDGIVEVKLTGACGTCPHAQMTLKMGVEKQLLADIPELKEVVSV